MHYTRWRVNGDPLTVKNGRGLTEREKFDARWVVDSDGCWLWTAGGNDSGYGRFAISHRQNVAPHRWAYEHFVGPIPEGLTIDHTCHTKACEGGDGCKHRRCVNPAHLEPVTLAVNLSRGHAPSAPNGAKTHCPSGHAYDEANTYVSKRGERTCRRCRRERARAARRQ